MKTSSRYVVSGFLLLGWTSLVLWKYFHSFPLLNLPEILQNGIMLGILLLFFTALGARILRLCSLSFQSFAEEVSIAFGIGSGVTALLMFALCALQVAHKAVIFLLIMLLFALLYQDAKSLCLRGYACLCAMFSRPWSPADVMLVSLIAVAGGTTFFAAATPPFFYDAMVYHLGVPQQYLVGHGFQYMPYHHFSNFPMNLGMLFMVGLSFSGGMLAKLISWSFAPMTAVAVYGLAKSRWGHHMALTAAAMAFLLPGVLSLSPLTSVDIGVMFYSFLSFSALLSWFTLSRKSWFVLSGIFCGLAVGTKYTALLMTFGTIMIILMCREYIFNRNRRVWTTFCSMALFGLLVLCVMSPWLSKNALYTGNPVYPLFNSMFDAHAAEYANYDNSLSAKNPILILLRSLVGQETLPSHYWRDTLLSYMTSPWTFTMNTTIKGAGKTGVLFLLLLPGLALLKNVDRDVWYWLGIAGSAFLLWQVFLPGNAIRYVFQIFPPLSIAAAYVVWAAPVGRMQRTGILIGVCLILGYHLLMFWKVTTVLNPFGYILKDQSYARFLLEKGINQYSVFDYINNETPPHSKILNVAEIRSYWCERRVVVSTNEPYSENAILLRGVIQESQNIEELLQTLQRMGITHILVNWSEMQRFIASQQRTGSEYFDFHTETASKIFQDLFSVRYIRELISENHVTLYEILYQHKGD